MNRLIKRLFGTKQQTTGKTAVRSAKESKMTIEESIRRYEQLCAK